MQKYIISVQMSKWILARKNSIEFPLCLFSTKNRYFYTREKSSGAISLNNHVTFLSRDLENAAIFQDFSMNFHEINYQEIKTIRLEWVKEFPC